MKKVLITGASSYVGARIFFDLRNKYEVVGTYNTHPLSRNFTKIDLTNKVEVDRVIKNIKPDIVIHVANYPSPRNIVNNETNFQLLNGKTTEYLVEIANQIDAKLIFISSQAANVRDNLYGELKYLSEELVKNTKSGYLILRPSFIVGFSPNTSNDRPFNRILRCLDDKNRIGEFDSSWKLQPTYIGHLSHVINGVIQSNAWNKTVPVFINEVVTQYQIAKDILSNFSISANKIDQHITIPVSTDDLTDFNRFNLYPHTYKEMIQTIFEEIKKRDTFTL